MGLNMQNEIVNIIRSNMDYFVMIRDLDPQYQGAIDEAIAISADEIVGLIK